MSEEEAAQAPQPGLLEPEEESVVQRVAALPVVKTTCSAVLEAYSTAKDRHPLLGSACRLAEYCVCGLTTCALDHARPLLGHLQPQLATVNHLACKGLDKLEEKLPFLQQPSETVVTSAKDTVNSGVTGVVDMARRGRRWSVELKRSVSHAVDVVLGKSEELVDHFLPMTEDELSETRVPPPVSFPLTRSPSPSWGSEWFRTRLRPHSASERNSEELKPTPHLPLRFPGSPTCYPPEIRLPRP